MAKFSVEDVCRAGCATPRAVRHWESEGLLGEVARSNGDHRRYTDEQLDRARIIAAAQFGNFQLADIKAMVDGYDREVYEALLIRLSDQAKAAVRLQQNLPTPRGENQEYDL